MSFETIDLWDSKVFVTDEVYTLINMCKRGDTPYRIAYCQNNYFIIDATASYTHQTALNKCEKFGFTKLKSNRTNFFIFVPKILNNQIISHHEFIGVHEYSCMLIYDFGYFLINNPTLIEQELFKCLGAYKKKIIIDSSSRNQWKFAKVFITDYNNTNQISMEIDKLAIEVENPLSDIWK